MKRFIAIIMTLCMVLGVSSIGAFGAEEGWKEEVPMPTAKYDMAASVVGDKIYAIGGEGYTVYNTVEIYDVQTNTWTTGQCMPTVRGHLTASVVGDKIYAIGGNDGRETLGTVEIYDIKTNTWTTGQSMPTARQYTTASVVGDKIYVIGGMNKANQIVDTVEIYDTQSDTWTTGQSMPTARYGLTASIVGDRIFAIGGGGVKKESVSTIEIYDIKTDTWTTGQSMPTARFALMSSVVGDTIYVIGGRVANNYLATVESLKVSNTETSSSLLSVLLNVGETVQLSTSYNLADNANYTWSSTNEAVATVDANGKVTAVAIGEVDIYAQNTDGTFKEYIPVKVVEGIADELRLAVHLKVGEKAKLYLTDNPSEVIWSSMDESVATVSSDGQVIGIKKGLAIIQGELAGQTYQIYVRVNG